MHMRVIFAKCAKGEKEEISKEYFLSCKQLKRFLLNLKCGISCIESNPTVNFVPFG